MSGQKTYLHVEGRSNRGKALRKLTGKQLRSLIRYCGKPEIHGNDTGEEILTLAMCEAVTRWMALGKGGWL